MATYTLSPNVKRQFLDGSGNPLASGKLYTYAAGTSTPATVYQTSSGTAHANPIVLDSAGRISGSSEVYLQPGQSYKFTLKTSADVEVWSQDNIGATPASTVNLEFTGTFGVAADAGDLMYQSDGSGSLTAGSWYKADADLTYASLTPELAFAVNAVTSGSTGTLRQGGIIDLSGLTPGTKYYVSATAGGVTATAPINARYVGQAQSITDLVISHTIADSSTDSVVIDPKIKDICDGRLTLSTGVPVTVTDVTAATTIYFTPYKGNQIALYNGTRWQAFTFSQLSIAVPATTNQVYDVFVDYNAGTPALSLTAWTNDTTRATALTTQDGVLVLTGTLGKRYVGSFRTTGVSGQTEDSGAKRYVWNYYHRVPRAFRVIESTDSWTYTTATIRQANGAATNQIDLVIGVAEVMLSATVAVSVLNDTAVVGVRVGFGEDSTSTMMTTQIGGGGQTAATAPIRPLSATINHYPAVGRHFYSWNEISAAGVGTTTWYSNTGAAFSVDQSGITGSIPG